LSDFHAAESGQGTTSKPEEDANESRDSQEKVGNGKGTSLLVPLSPNW
jgi:hypothetical protein